MLARNMLRESVMDMAIQRRIVRYLTQYPGLTALQLCVAMRDHSNDGRLATLKELCAMHVRGQVGVVDDGRSARLYYLDPGSV